MCWPGNRETQHLILALRNIFQRVPSLGQASISFFKAGISPCCLDLKPRRWGWLWPCILKDQGASEERFHLQARSEKIQKEKMKSQLRSLAIIPWPAPMCLPIWWRAVSHQSNLQRTRKKKACGEQGTMGQTLSAGVQRPGSEGEYGPGSNRLSGDCGERKGVMMSLHDYFTLLHSYILTYFS